MLRKNFAATGSFIEDDRPRALELLGYNASETPPETRYVMGHPADVRLPGAETDRTDAAQSVAVRAARAPALAGPRTTGIWRSVAT